MSKKLKWTNPALKPIEVHSKKEMLYHECANGSGASGQADVCVTGFSAIGSVGGACTANGIGASATSLNAAWTCMAGTTAKEGACPCHSGTSATTSILSPRSCAACSNGTSPIGHPDDFSNCGTGTSPQQI